MAFTEVFDNTFPLDTQQAKLLGDDIRKFKVDIQERMAAISGLDAAKPNFAADTQPTKWNGIIFLATDTGIIYRFSNPSWIAVSLVSLGYHKYSQTVANGTTTTTDNQVMATITIPTGIIVSGSMAEFMFGQVAGNPPSGAATGMKVSANGTASGLVYSVDNAGANGVINFKIFMASVTKAIFTDFEGTVLGPVTVADVTANDLIITIRQSGAGSLNCYFGDAYFTAVVFP